MPSPFAKVLIACLEEPLDYRIPEGLSLVAGMQVLVPLGNRTVEGLVWDFADTTPFKKVKSILSCKEEKPFLTPPLMALAKWMANYYLAPLNKVLRTMLPAVLRKGMAPKTQWIVRRKKTKEELLLLCRTLREKAPPQADVLEVMLRVKKEILLTELLELSGTSRSPLDSLVKKQALLLEKAHLDRSPLVGEEYFPSSKKTLNEEQKEALTKIENSLGAFQTHLIHGVTGSGKTEVYLQAIEKALTRGKSALLLVPEIALTLQTIERFKSRFQEEIAILHHRLSDGERFDTLKKIQEGKIRICIGARSAVFCPLQNLGLIIVDEEHESSYKQTEETPCYHARDVCVMRGKLENVPVILGSATPSLESFWNALQGKYLLSTLSSRATQSQLPKVTFVDMNKEMEKGNHHFSDTLLSAIEKRLHQGEQTILFLNRRGYHTALFCPSCKTKMECAHCAVSLTYHKKTNSLSCHLCGCTFSPPPTLCPKCKKSEPMKFQGVGTELIEKRLLALFPSIRVIRMDGDTTRHKGSHQTLYRSFATGKADVLIGTQMVAKGLHFPQVTLVGILNADAGLHIPDFRAAENTFQMITQVAGRAGRGAFSGEVILQTSLPENRALQLAGAQDYLTFYKEEIATRQLLNYPPVSQMIKLTFSGREEKKTLKEATAFREKLLPHFPKSVEIYPVLPCGHVKIKDTYRFQCLLQAPKTFPLISRLQKVLSSPSKAFRLHIDVNPTSTF